MKISYIAGEPFEANSISAQARGLQMWIPIIDSGGMSSCRNRVFQNEAATVLGTGMSWGSDSDCGAVLNFGLSQNYLSLPATSSAFGARLASGNATFSMWVKLRNATPSSANNTGFAWLLTNDTNSQNYPYTDGRAYVGTLRNTRVAVTLSTLVDRSAWHLVTVTTSSTNGWQFYQNGILCASASGETFPTSNGTNWNIGGAFWNIQSNLDGWVRDIRIYSRWMTQPEVLDLYNPQTRWDLYKPLRGDVIYKQLVSPAMRWWHGA